MCLNSTQDLFTEAAFDGIYRDDGIVVLKGNKSKSDVINWLNTLQKRVDELVEYDNLIFTAVLWDADNNKDDAPKHRRVKVENENYFPYLDMKMYWSNTNNKLNFGVYIKPNQQLKYLNKDSSHTSHGLAL